MNAYLRFKRGLTEDTPSSPSYREDLWAELPDYKETPVDESLTLLEGLHRRFTILLLALGPQDMHRTMIHSTLGLINLDTALHRYVWHNRHHITQITQLCERMEWCVSGACASPAAGSLHLGKTGDEHAKKR